VEANELIGDAEAHQTAKEAQRDQEAKAAADAAVLVPELVHD